MITLFALSSTFVARDHPNHGGFDTEDFFEALASLQAFVNDYARSVPQQLPQE